MDSLSFRLTVFFDGACAVCADEIARFARLDHRNQLNLVDIGQSNFDPASYGRNTEDFTLHLHVQDERGNFYTGIDAFSMIWHTLSQPRGIFGKNWHPSYNAGENLTNIFRRIIPLRKYSENENSLRK